MYKRKLEEIISDMSARFPKILYILSKFKSKIIDLNVDNNYVEKRIKLGKKALKENTKNKDTLYIICANGIGDTVIVASYCGFLKEKYNFKKLKLIVCPHQEYVGEIFDYISGSQIVTKEEMNNIVYYIQKTKQFRKVNYLYAFFEQEINKLGQANYYSTKWDSKKLLSERYKESLFNIPIDTKPSKITLIEDKKIIEKTLKKNKLTKKSIVLMPISHSEIKMTNEFWENLAKALTEKGYKVYTNVGKNEVPIKNTYPLDVSLKELIYIANEIKFFISMRSGVCEYLSLTSPNLIVLNNSIKNNFKWDDVNTFDPKNQIINMYTRNKKEEDILKEIVSNIERR